MPKPDMRLMNALSFAASDLNANQHGVLTTAQQRVLSRQRTALVRRFLGLVIFIAVSIDGFSVLFFLMQTNRDSMILAIAPIISVALLGLTAPLIRKWQKIGVDLRNGVVQSAEGQVTLDVHVIFRGVQQLALR